MLHFDATTAQCHVFTYKEGLLSSVAHDLKLEVRTFTVEVDPDRPAVTARFDPSSLRVVSAMADGQPRSQALSDSDKRKIESNIVGEVLEARRHGEVSFVSTEVTRAGDGFAVRGQLTLHGQTRELRFTTQPIDGRQVAEVVLHQPDFGIQPYSALLGTLRIKPDVRVRLSLPLPELPAARP